MIIHKKGWLKDMGTMMIAIMAIFMMVFANFLILFARQKQGWLRNAVSLIAYLLLLPIALLIFIVLFS